MPFKLRPHQVDNVASVREAFLEHQNVALVSPTGSGKTVIGAEIIKRVADNGHSVLFLAHRDTLIKQAGRKLKDSGVDHGIIMAGYTPKPGCSVQVGSVQTMVRRIKKCKYDFKLIVIDECHLSAAKSYIDIVKSMPNARVLGLTGTFGRLDGKGLGRVAGGIFDHMVIGSTPQQLIDEGYLVRPEVYASETQLDLSKIKMVGGDYDEDELAAVVDNSVITGSAVDHYQRICPNAPAIAWCVNIKHAKHVAEEFNAAGIPAMALHGEHTGDERDEAGRKLETGELKVVVFCQLLVEGVDWPHVAAVIMLRPTYSMVSYRQVVGRGLRTIYADGFDLDDLDGRLAAIEASGKGCSYVLDHAGLTFRHGFVTDDIEWSLEGTPKGKKKKADAGARVDIKQCPKCWHVFMAAPACPKCGHVMPAHERTVEVVEGNLTKITPEDLARTKRLKNQRIAKADTLEKLQELGAEFGYSPRWANVRWDLKLTAKKRHQTQKDALMKHYEQHYH